MASFIACVTVLYTFNTNSIENNLVFDAQVEEHQQSRHFKEIRQEREGAKPECAKASQPDDKWTPRYIFDKKECRK